MFRRFEKNPIYSPHGRGWESYAVFNPSVIHRDDQWKMLYRALGEEESVHGHWLRVSRIGCASSPNGRDFSGGSILLAPEAPFDLFGCEDPRVTFFEGKYHIF